jgi:hypothetical protein
MEGDGMLPNSVKSKAKRMLIVVGLISVILGTIESLALDSEPDWTNRFSVIRQQFYEAFKAPVVGQTITVSPRIGADYTGTITAITTNYIVVDAERYEARQLTDDTCCKLFPSWAAARQAREQIVRERDAYREQQIQEQKKTEEEALRVAKENEEKRIKEIQRNEAAKIASVSNPPTSAPSHDNGKKSVTPPAPAPVDNGSSIVGTVAVLIILVLVILAIVRNASNRPNFKNQAAISAGPVTCPKCGSPSIMGAKEGYDAGSGCCGALLFGPLGLFCGSIGSKKVNVHCLNCGHKWRK